MKFDWNVFVYFIPFFLVTAPLLLHTGQSSVFSLVLGEGIYVGLDTEAYTWLHVLQTAVVQMLEKQMGPEPFRKVRGCRCIILWNLVFPS